MKSYYQVRGASLGAKENPLYELMRAVDAHPWKRRGLCRNVDPDLFFAEGQGSPDTKDARKICRGTIDTPPCPVLAECLAYALEHTDEQGVWGGTTAPERSKMRGNAEKVRRRRAA